MNTDSESEQLQYFLRISNIVHIYKDTKFMHKKIVFQHKKNFVLIEYITLYMSLYIHMHIRHHVIIWTKSEVTNAKRKS